MEPDRNCQDANFFLAHSTLHLETCKFNFQRNRLVSRLLLCSMARLYNFFQFGIAQTVLFLTKQCSKNCGSSVLTCSKRSAVVPCSTTFVNHSLSVCSKHTKWQVCCHLILVCIFIEIPYHQDSLRTYLTSILVVPYHKEMSQGLHESRQVLLEMPYETLPKQLWHFRDTCKGRHSVVFYYSAAHPQDQYCQTCSGQF